MSQPNTMNQIPNGVPAHLNGGDSSHSSRDSSPSMRMYQQISSSQHPPSRVIPQNQLPPMKNPNFAKHITPLSSPKVFSTSTPTTDVTNVSASEGQKTNFNPGQVLSPISTSTFTHSATSHFSNVPLGGKTEQNSNPQAQLISQRINPQNVPSESRQGLPHQNSLPGASFQPKPALQPSSSQPRLMAYNQNPPSSNGQSVTPNQSSRSTPTQPSNAFVMQQMAQNLPQNYSPAHQFNLNQQAMGKQNVQSTATRSLTGTPTNMTQTSFVAPISQPGNVQNQNMNQKPVQINSMVAPPMIQTSIASNLSNVPQPKMLPTSQPNLTSMHQQTSQHPQGMPSLTTQSVPMNRAVNPPINNSGQVSMPQPGLPPNPAYQSMRGPPMSQPPIQAYANYPQNAPNQLNKPADFPHNAPTQPIRPPDLISHVPTANLYQKQMPVKTNSLPESNAPPRTNSVHSNRYAPQQRSQQFPPQQQQQIPYQNYSQQQQQQQPQQQQSSHYNQNYQQQSVSNVGFNKLWGSESVDLLQTPVILPPTKVETPRISLGKEQMDQANCSPEIFRCTMTKIPENNSLLQKSRLPLGVLIHPFKDLNHLPVIQCNTIVRCRACRTYINPFVFFVDNKRWKCNLCYRVNELPDEFQYDPVTKTYGDPSRRPEVRTSTIEYIAPAEYMLRPPQPAVYLFLFDISRAAIDSGYLYTVCNVLSSELTNLPGDARTHIGFIAYDSALHFYSLADGLSQPHEMTVLDIDDIFLPCPDNLLVNLQDRIELINDLLTQLPNRYNTSYNTGSALGSALQAAHKMMASTGGRVTVFQASLPTVGPGALTAREDPSQRASSEVQHLNPANDFYKRLALECSGQQIAVDLFLVNSQYIDLATLSGISKFSGGCIYHFPLFKTGRVLQNEAFERSLRRYFTRKIGFEAVMRIRCTRGLSIHTFHGNFFVRSTDLLSLPNVNPDSGFGMQVAIEESLSDVQTVCFQAALLYTSSKGERRIRVHTMCIPVANNLTDVINSADQQCIVGLLAKMAVDRSTQSSLSDAREAFINVAIDILSSYKLAQNMSSGMSGLLAPKCLRLLPLYISALLKSVAFRGGISTRLDDRVKAMCDMKTRPLPNLIQTIYPDLYPIHNLQDQTTVINDDEEPVHLPPLLQLSARSIDSNGAYLLDMGEHMVIIVCPAISTVFLNQVLGVTDYNSIADTMYDLPILENEHNHRLHMFLNYLNEEKPMNATLQIMRDNSSQRTVVLEKLIEDRMETALSYHEFLQHLKTQVK